MTMTLTLIEDGSNVCYRKSPSVLGAIGLGKSHETMSEDNMSRSVHKSRIEKKEMREKCGKFDVNLECVQE